MKKILLAVCGLSPQVITETLYVLLMQGRLVNAIRVLTTREGRVACMANLMDPEFGYYYRFLSDYNLKPDDIDFSSKHIIAVADRYGRAIDDICTEEQNELFFQSCMDESFRLTSESQNAVYFSIAGGRKTMGAALALSAQFYGRPQDRIFHVLVSPEFESCRDFYYPPPQSKPIELRAPDGSYFTKETQFAQISLAHMPFPLLREQLSNEMLQKPEPPSALLVSLVREERSEMVIDLKQCHLIWRGTQLDLPPAQISLYAFFVLLKKDCSLPSSCSICFDCFLEYTDLLAQQNKLSELYYRVTSSKTVMATSDTGILSLNQENFNAYKSKINNSLQSRFGPYESDLLKISSKGSRPGVRYGIKLDKQMMTLIL